MDNSFSYQTGQYVKWSWGNGQATGQVEERFERDVTRTLKGSEITRHGDSENPAYLVKQDDGSRVLKRGSELEAWQRD
jgi:hypothetical protein